jgi:hypothetical protein
MTYTESNSEDPRTSPENVLGFRSEQSVSKRHQTTTSTAFSRSFEAQLWSLEQLYVLNEKEEVVQFLRKYPFLDNWWWQASKKADGRVAFGLGG